MPIFLLPLLNWIAGGILKPLFGAALDAWKAKLSAEDSIDKHTIDLAARELTLEQKAREVDAQLVTAEQGHWYTAMVRPLFAAPFVIYVWKLVVWDKVFAGWTHGTTDPLSPWLASMATVILTAYFGGISFERMTRLITTRRAK